MENNSEQSVKPWQECQRQGEPVAVADWGPTFVHAFDGWLSHFNKQLGRELTPTEQRIAYSAWVDSRAYCASTTHAVQSQADDVRDAARYRKLRRWMSSNVPEGWGEVEKLAAIACHMDWDNFDMALDALPECNVGLCHRTTSAAPADKEGK